MKPKTMKPKTMKLHPTSLKTFLAAFAVVALAASANSYGQLLVNTLNNPTVITFENGSPGQNAGSAYTGLGWSGANGAFTQSTSVFAARSGTSIVNINAYNPVGDTSAQQSRYGLAATGAVITGRLARGANSTADFGADLFGMGSSSLSTNTEGLAVQGTILSFRPRPSDNVGFYVNLQNTTGSTVNSWAVGYQAFFIDINSLATNIEFAYSIDGGASFTSIAALSGTSSGTNTTPTPDVDSWERLSINGNTAGTPVSFNAEVANNANIVLRWVVSAVGDGNRVGIDNLSIAAIPEPSTWALLAASLTALVVLRRRRQASQINRHENPLIHP
jgi:hypothetical protein